jgi:hypothetical protein
MRVLVACEESQTVCKAFRARGHEAYSCDIQECSGGHPEWHIQDDVLYHLSEGWDLMIGHPPCTYFSRAAGIVLYNKEHLKKTEDAFRFFLTLWNAPIPKIALENPPGWLSTNFRKWNQKIHPWYFGDGEMKETCLWLKNLPRLNGLLAIAKEPAKHHPKPTGSRMGSDGKIKNFYFMHRVQNPKDRAKTFPGIANAMAEQWG